MNIFKKNKKNCLFVFIFFVLSFPLAAQEYRKPMPSLPVSLDPPIYIDGPSILIASQVYDRLVDFDELLNIQPNLMESWTNRERGKVWVFNLRQGVYFHNNKELTSDDVIFSIKNLMGKESVRRHEFSIIRGAKEYQSGKAKNVAGIKRISKYSLEIELEEPFSLFLHYFGAPNSEIIPEDYAGMLKEAFLKHPVGTGPFKFVEYKDDVFKIAANEKYFKGKPRLDIIIFEKSTSEKALKGFNEGYFHDLDRYYFSTTDIKRNYTSIRSLRANTNVIALNVRKKPFSNVHFRKAIVYAFNKKEVYDNCFSSHIMANCFVPPGLGGHYPNMEQLPYDLEKARKEIKLANITEEDRKRVYTLIRPDNHPCKDGFSKFISKTAEKIGLKFKVIYLPLDKMISEYIMEKKYDMYSLNFTADNPEAFFILNYFRSDYPLSLGSEVGGEIDILLKKVPQLQDKYERFKVYKELQKIVRDRALIIPLYHMVVPQIFQSNIRGVLNPPLTEYIAPMWSVYIEENVK